MHRSVGVRTVFSGNATEIRDGKLSRSLIKFAHSRSNQSLGGKRDQLVSFVAELRIVPCDIVGHL